MPINLRNNSSTGVNITSIEDLANIHVSTGTTDSKTERKITERKLGYVYEKDKLALSYSRRQTLNRCPRLFQLREIKQRKSRRASIDTAFGSAFGAGVQELFRYGCIQRATVAALASWDYPEFEDIYGKKKDKSLATCLETLEVFYSQLYPSLDAEYRLADIGGKPGIELFVYMNITPDVNYQIHVDLILQNRTTQALAIVEIKTSGMQAIEAEWGNSSQTLGYYAIIETISRQLNLPIEPMVYYLCVHAGKMHDPSCGYGFQIFPFVKTPNALLDFARELMHDVARIEYSLSHDYFPKNGAACVAYRSPCEFYGLCDMASMQDEEIGSTYQSLTLDDVDFIISLDDVLSTVENHFLTD